MAKCAQWAVELDAFGKSYAGGWTLTKTRAVHGVSLRIEPGKVLGLFGPNGSGKSTCLKAMAGLVAPSEGRCWIHGEEAGSSAARESVGYLPDSPRFPPWETARALLNYHAELCGIPPSIRRAAVEDRLTWAGLGDAGGRPIGGFSKGMRQRLGLAIALLDGPSVVLLDEPTSGLDPEGRLLVNRLIGELAGEGRTVVFTSHLLTQAEGLCDRLAILGRGRLLVEGAVEAVLGVGKGKAPAPVIELEKLYLEKLHAAAK